MRNKDQKNLENIYEDLSGYDIPQYGSEAPIVSQPMGAETLKSKYVEVPEDQEKETDDEDEEVEDSMGKLIDDIQDKIRSYLDKKQEKLQTKIDNELNPDKL